MASNTDKLRKSYSFLQKSLGGSIGDSDSSLTLNNYTNIPTDTAVDFIIDRIDANGNRTNDKRELVTGVCTGSAITGLVRGLHGTTAQAHDGGAIVEFVASGASWNDLIDAFLEEHNQDGTHDNTKIVKTSGAQTIAGVKTFSDTPVVPNGSWDTDTFAQGAVTPEKLALGAASNFVGTSQSTTSTAYVALATAQEITVTVGPSGQLLVGINCSTGNSGADLQSRMSFALSGANTLAASNANAAHFQAYQNNAFQQVSKVQLLTGLNPGSTTVAARFNVTGGTGEFSNRTIWAIPL